MIYDKETLDDILKNGFQSGSPSYYELELLAVHFREQGYGKVGIKKRVVEMSRKLYIGFNPVVYFDYLERAVYMAMKKGSLREMSDVVVYQEELDAIRQIRDYKAQLIMFSFLVNAKSQGYSSILSVSKDIKSYLSMSTTRVTYRKFLREYRIMLEDLGMLKYVIYRRGKLKSKYVLPFIVDEGTPVMLFYDMEQVNQCAERYKEWTGGELFWCSTCGKEEVKTSRNQRRCKECARKTKKAYDREYHKSKKEV